MYKRYWGASRELLIFTARPAKSQEFPTSGMFEGKMSPKVRKLKMRHFTKKCKSFGKIYLNGDMGYFPIIRK